MLDRYVADRLIHMKRNPNAVAATDPIRKAYVDRIEIKLDARDDVAQVRAVESGSADGFFGGEPPAATTNQLRGDPRLHIKVGDGCISYVVLNLQRGGAGGAALRNRLVRQAINVGLDKRAVVRVFGGDAYSKPTGQILTSPVLGYRRYDPFATPGSRGDPSRAKRMLADAGYPRGIDLTFIYRRARHGEAVYRVVRDSLQQAGIRLHPLFVPDNDYYSRHLSNPTAHDWDLAAVAWCPDWNGNTARSFFVPLLDGRYYYEGTVNYGGYNNDAVNQRVDAALTEADPRQVAARWAEIDRMVTTDAPWVPLVERNAVTLLSARVRGYVYYPTSAGLDPVNIWLVAGA
jgi:peptide/nickel transport system substrate-binding protein